MKKYDEAIGQVLIIHITNRRIFAIHFYKSVLKLWIMEGKNLKTKKGSVSQ